MAITTHHNAATIENLETGEVESITTYECETLADLEALFAMHESADVVDRFDRFNRA
jgi:hypothetical protein